MPTLRRGALVALLALAAARPARAADDAATVEAKEHFKKGTRLYEVAKFAEALEEFKAAYEIKPISDILFNIAQCHRRLGNHDAAIFFYRGFLAHLPPDVDKKEVERLMAEVEAAKAAQAEAEKRRREAKVALEPDASHDLQPSFADGGEVVAAERPVYKRPVFWIATGAAVVVAAVVITVVAVLATQTVTPSGKLGTIDDRP